MGKFFNWLRGVQDIPQVVQSVEPVVDAEVLIPTASKVQYAKLRRVASPVLSFKMRTGVSEFEQPEYDMAEVGRIRDVESYVARAFSLKEGLMFKEGYEFVGKNPTTIQYIKKRFEQISHVTGLPTYLITTGVGEDLIQYHNAFLVKVRNAKASGGAPRKRLGLTSILQPVAGYFPAPVSTIFFQRDDFGKILKYRQYTPDGKYVEFNPEDVIHFFMCRKKGFLVGTPSLISVKDDIRALRRIEENIEMLIYQNLFPLFQYKVGTEDHPAGVMPDGTREIDAVKQEIELMPAEGMIVTPERHEISAIGSEGRALRAEGYLKHFRDRLISGLGVSGIDVGLGETANRSTSDSMSRNLVDDVKHYQQIFEEFFNEYVLKELLLESTFPDPLNEENIVRIKFHEIDLDAKIKVQNHAIQAFSGHAITHSEMRREFGAEPFTEKDWEDSFWKLIEEPKDLIRAADEPFSAAAQAVAKNKQTSIEPEDLETEQSGRDREIAKTGKAPSGGTPKGSSNKPTSGQRASGASNRPSNQHGRKTGSEKRKSSFSGNLTDMVAPNNVVTDIYDDLLSSTLNSVAAGTFSVDWFEKLSRAAGTQMTDKLARSMRTDFRKGYRSLPANVKQVPSTPNTEIDERTERFLRRLFGELQKQIKEIYTPTDTEAFRKRLVVVFDTLRYRTRFIFNSECKRAYNYGIVVSMRDLGDNSFGVAIDSQGCSECLEQADTEFDIKYAVLDNVPPFHTNCECIVKRLRKEQEYGHSSYYNQIQLYSFIQSY